MNSSQEIKPAEILNGFLDTHIHTSPDVKPRLLNDYEAALEAKESGMAAIVIKSHVEPTAGRAYLAHWVTGLPVVGGVTLNHNVGGLNPHAVRSMASIGGKIVWLPTIHHQEIKLEHDPLEEILNLVKENNLVLATGHLNSEEIFQVLDHCRSLGVEKIMINHPLTRVVGASMDEQKEMSRYAYLEHCWVATMPHHDKLNPEVMVEAIKEVGAQHCILATDFGQDHNPSPVMGMQMMITTMIEQGIPWEDIILMCRNNPENLLFK
jgi:Predicted metal-dependent hydrolases with the TIM-barrel fold